MRIKLSLLSILLLVLISGPLQSAAAAQAVTGISPAEIAGAPDKYCNVTKEPDPALLGGWKGVHQRWDIKTSEYRTEPVEYYLKKVGSRYALYFYRHKPENDATVTVYHGWRDWDINGSQISATTGVRIFAKDGAVYYSWKNDKPTQLTRNEKLGTPDLAQPAK